MNLDALQRKLAKLERKRYLTFVSEQEVTTLMWNDGSRHETLKELSQRMIGMRYADGLSIRAESLDKQIAEVKDEIAALAV